MRFGFVANRRKYPDHLVVLTPRVVIRVPYTRHMHLCGNLDAADASSVKWEQRERPYGRSGCVFPRKLDGECASKLGRMTLSWGTTAIPDGLPGRERGAGIFEWALGFRFLATASYVIVGWVVEKEHCAERFGIGCGSPVAHFHLEAVEVELLKLGLVCCIEDNLARDRAPPPAICGSDW